MPLIRLCVVAIFVVTAEIAFSQSALVLDSAKVQYSNQLYSGGLFGKSQAGVTASFAFVNGIRYKRMIAGVGIGYDDYSRAESYFYNQFYLRWKTVPVFASVSVDFAKLKSSALYFQLNTGYSWMWAAPGNYIPDVTSNGGAMIHPVVGYRIVSGKFAMTLSGGYKWQKHQYQYGDQWGGGTYEVSQTFQRVTIQVGFGLY